MVNTLTPRAEMLTPAQRDDVVRAYVARRFIPKGKRGGQKWQPPHGATMTDAYDLIHHMGFGELVGATKDRFVAWVAAHPEYAPDHSSIVVVEPPTPEPETRFYPVPTSTNITLDAALLEQMIRAEVQRVIKSIRGEMEQSIAHDVEQALGRAVAARGEVITRNLAATLDAVVAEVVDRRLEEITAP
jgi:hypothetical protein